MKSLIFTTLKIRISKTQLFNGIRAWIRLLHWFESLWNVHDFYIDINSEQINSARTSNRWKRRNTSDILRRGCGKFHSKWNFYRSVLRGNYHSDWRRVSWVFFFACEWVRDTTHEVKVFIGWSFLNGIWSRPVRPRRTIERPYLSYCFIHPSIIILVVLQASHSKRCVKPRGKRKVGARSFPNAANWSV